MGLTPRADLRTARLRANAAYELVLFDRLSGPEQQVLEALGRDPEGYGVLRPRGEGPLSLKSVTRDIALLWLTLREPGPLPKYALRLLGDDCDRIVGQMILDGILEIEAEEQMLSGMAALALLSRDGDAGSDPGAIGGLSRRALEYAAMLEIPDALGLSARLYGYNSVPAREHWRRRWPDTAAIEHELGIENGAWGALLPGWTRVAWGTAWIAWNRGDMKAARDETIYKLYISPGCGALRTAFQEAAAAIAACHGVHLKVGASVFGLLRPDKMVGYFRELADLQEAAERILERLADCPAQGVPFTAEIGGGGLLSWGVDPDRDQYAVPWLERESWRARICNQLAGTLIQARASGCEDAEGACRFARERLRLEGIDPETWAPTRELHWS
ncbi:MAG: hypothetical protein WCC14_16655 [Acidobacteriaceae bacterium]